MERGAILLALTGLSMAFAGCTWLEESTDTNLTNTSPDMGAAPSPAPTPATTTPPPPATTTPATATPVTTTPARPSQAPPLHGPPTPAPTTTPVAAPPVVPPTSPTNPVHATTPVQPGGQHQSWPREGSYVHYRVEGWVTRGDARDSLAWVNWTYSDGDWRAVCEGTETRRDDGDARTQRIRETISVEDPPHWPLLNTRSPPGVGDDMEAWHLWTCRIASDTRSYVGIRDGVHVAQGTHPSDQYHTEWDPVTGLVRGWDLHQTGGGTFGVLVNTDAPLGKPAGYAAPHG